MKRRSAILSALCAFVLTVASARSSDQVSEPKPAGSTLRIVNDSLFANGNFYNVKGSIYNPNSEGVKDIVVRYYVWKKWMGADGHGSVIKETGGLVSATIKYLPPKQTVDFVATGENAPVMTQKSGLMPDPISAEIVAQWDQ